MRFLGSGRTPERRTRLELRQTPPPPPRRRHLLICGGGGGRVAGRQWIRSVQSPGALAHRAFAIRSEFSSRRRNGRVSVVVVVDVVVCVAGLISEIDVGTQSGAHECLMTPGAADAGRGDSRASGPPGLPGPQDRLGPMLTTRQT